MGHTVGHSYFCGRQTFSNILICKSQACVVTLPPILLRCPQLVRAMKAVFAMALVKVVAASDGMPSCSDLCSDGGHGSYGFISGTAPFCGGDCSDCGGNYCYHVEEGSVSDYGSGCATGNKVCCCDPGAAVPVKVEAKVMPSCSDLCSDGGHGSYGFISGTAPFCGG